MKKRSLLVLPKDETIAGLVIACKYSWNCKAAREFKISDLLYNFAELGSQATLNQIDLVKAALKVLNPYYDYREIAKDWNIKNYFDYEVTANYWRPRSQTRKPRICHNWAILKRLLDDKKELYKIRAIGNAAQLNETFVHAGKIVRDLDDSLAIRYRPMIMSGFFLELGNDETKVIKKAFVPIREEGGDISFHFSAAAESLSAGEASQLTTLNNILLSTFNEKLQNIFNKSPT